MHTMNTQVDGGSFARFNNVLLNLLFCFGNNFFNPLLFYLVHDHSEIGQYHLDVDFKLIASQYLPLALLFRLNAAD